jgi:hypothetical protein
MNPIRCRVRPPAKVLGRRQPAAEALAYATIWDFVFGLLHRFQPMKLPTPYELVGVECCSVSVSLLERQERACLSRDTRLIFLLCLDAWLQSNAPPDNEQHSP